MQHLPLNLNTASDPDICSSSFYFNDLLFVMLKKNLSYIFE